MPRALITMPEVLDRTLQKFGAVRVLIQPVAQFRAIASHLRATTLQREEDAPAAAAAAAAPRDFIAAMDAATNAMNVCESHALRAVFFHQFYQSQLTGAIDVLLAVAAADAATTTNDPVLQYIMTAGVGASTDVPDSELINLMDRLMEPEGSPRSRSHVMNAFIRHSRRQGIVADGIDFRRQLHELSGLSPSHQRQPMNEPRIWQLIDELATKLPPIATIVPASGHQHHHENHWTAVQRNIRNASTVQDFERLYDALDIGQLPVRFGIHADAYERWASDLTLSSASSSQRHAAALALYRHVCTVRLFYFELYRRYQSGFISEAKILQYSKWFINGLLHCLRADRAYTLVYRQLDWIKQNDLLSRGNSGNFRLHRPNDGCGDETKKMATIHPIYESYVTMFSALVVNHPTILDHQRPASLSSSSLPAVARRSSSSTAAVTTTLPATVAAVVVVATTTTTETVPAVWRHGGAGPNDGDNDDGHHVVVDGEMVLLVEEDNDRGDGGDGGAP
jgi:hypothetical protein